MCFYGKKMAFCSASGLRSQIFRCAQNDRDRQQNNCQEYYFSLVKKSKNAICIPPSSKGWSDLNPKMMQTYLPINAQQLIHSLKFSCIFVRKKVTPIYAILMRSVLHIYTVGLYNYTFHPFSVTSSPVRVHTLYCPCAHPVIVCLKKLRRPCAHG